MPDGGVADEGFEGVGAEDIRHQTHLLMGMDAAVVQCANTCGFLSPMLQGVDSEVGDFGGFRMAPDAEHAALIMGFIVRQELVRIDCIVETLVHPTPPGIRTAVPQNTEETKTQKPTAAQSSGASAKCLSTHLFFDGREERLCGFCHR